MRFIPTGVGNTTPRPRWGFFISVHPHGRGEHRQAVIDLVMCHGSSPRAWGTPESRPGTTTARRFIPTGVGNTGPGDWCGGGNPVHPHGRGEHSLPARMYSSMAGSSPRAWGTHRLPSAADREPRFIPTGVGNTPPPCARISRAAVHPHGRGEHLLPVRHRQKKAGSSPRAWGTLFRKKVIISL